MVEVRRLLQIGSSGGLLVAALLLLNCSSPASPTTTTVQPVTPSAPELTCPADITQQSPDDGAVTISYTTPTAVNGTTPVAVACTPASGTSFSPGTTAVKCTATDAISRTATCSFNVKITLIPKLAKTRFCAFGDSMTSGVITLRAPLYTLIPSSVSYPGRLLSLLAMRYVSQTVAMDDEGLGGELALDGMKRLPSVLRDTQPQVVMLMEGVNDLNDYGPTVLEDTAWAMDQMIVKVIDAGAVPMIATLPPQRAGGLRAPYPELIAPYNARLTQIAAATHAILVDVYGAFGGVASTDLIGSDGLHPTEAGYEKIAETFAAAIQANLEAAPTTTTARRTLKSR